VFNHDYQFPLILCGSFLTLGNLLGKFLVKGLPLLVNSLVKDSKKAIKKEERRSTPHNFGLIAKTLLLTLV